MLILGRKAGESLTIGGDISITVLSVDSGGNVSLGIQAPKEMLILRSELQQAVSSNQEAAQSPLYSTAPRVSGVCVPQGGGCNPAVGSAQMILKDWRQVE